MKYFGSFYGGAGISSVGTERGLADDSTTIGKDLGGFNLFSLSDAGSLASRRNLAQGPRSDFFADISALVSKSRSKSPQKSALKTDECPEIKGYRKISNSQWYVVTTANDEEYYYNQQSRQVTKELPSSIRDHRNREEFTIRDVVRRGRIVAEPDMRNSRIHTFLEFSKMNSMRQGEASPRQDRKEVPDSEWFAGNGWYSKYVDSILKSKSDSLEKRRARGDENFLNPSLLEGSNEKKQHSPKVEESAPILHDGSSFMNELAIQSTVNVARPTKVKSKEDIVHQIIGTVISSPGMEERREAISLPDVDMNALELRLFNRRVIAEEENEKDEIGESMCEDEGLENSALEVRKIAVSDGNLGVKISDILSDPVLPSGGEESAGGKLDLDFGLTSLRTTPLPDNAKCLGDGEFDENELKKLQAINYDLLERSDMCISQWGGAKWLLDRTKGLCQTLLDRLKNNDLGSKAFYVLITNLCIRAKAYAVLCNQHKSMACIRILRGLNPAYAYYAHGSVMQIFGLEMESLDFFKKSLEFRPDFYPSVYAMLSVQTSLGMLVEASNTLILAKRLNPQGYQVHVIECKLWIRLKNFNRAAHWIRRLSIFPERVETWLIKVEWHLNQGNLRGAEALVHEAIEFNPRHIGPWMMYAYLLQLQQQYSKASHAYKHALEIQPVNVFCLIGLSSCMFQMQQHVACVQLVDRVLEWNPNCFEALFNRSKCAMHANEYEAAMVSLEKCLEIRPENEQVNLLFALSLSGSGDNQSALTYLEYWLKGRGECSSKGWVTRGYIFMNESKAREALICFERALELDEFELEAQMGKVSALFALDRAKEAEEFSAKIRMSESLKKLANKAGSSVRVEGADDEDPEAFLDVIKQLDFGKNMEMDNGEFGLSDPRERLQDIQKDAQIEYEYLNSELGSLAEKMGIANAETIEDVDIGGVEARFTRDPDLLFEVSERLDRLKDITKIPDDVGPMKHSGIIKDHVISSFDIKKKDYIEYEKGIEDIGKSIDAVGTGMKDLKDDLKAKREKSRKGNTEIGEYWREFSKKTGFKHSYDELLKMATLKRRWPKPKKIALGRYLGAINNALLDIKKKNEELGLSSATLSFELQSPIKMSREEISAIVDEHVPKSVAKMFSKRYLIDKLFKGNYEGVSLDNLERELELRRNKFYRALSKARVERVKANSKQGVSMSNIKRFERIKANSKRKLNIKRIGTKAREWRLDGNVGHCIEAKSMQEIREGQKDEDGGRLESVAPFSFSLDMERNREANPQIGGTRCKQKKFDAKAGDDARKRLKLQFDSLNDKMVSITEEELEQIVLSGTKIDDSTIESLIEKNKKPPSKEVLLKVLTKLRDGNGRPQRKELAIDGLFRTVPTKEDLDSFIESRITAYGNLEADSTSRLDDVNDPGLSSGGDILRIDGDGSVGTTLTLREGQLPEDVSANDKTTHPSRNDATCDNSIGIAKKRAKSHKFNAKTTEENFNGGDMDMSEGSAEFIRNLDMNQLNSNETFEKLLSIEMEVSRRNYYRNVKSLAFPPFDEVAERKRLNKRIKKQLKKLIFKMIALKPEIFELIKTPDGLKKLTSHLDELADSLTPEKIKKIKSDSNDLFSVLNNQEDIYKSKL